MRKEASENNRGQYRQPDGVTRGGADTLLSSKLRPSQARPKLVARPRLVERLAPEAGRRLTLVSAPAGFGKTTLLGGWAEDRAAGGRSVAWLSLDGGDNDPARFLSYLVASLQTVEEGFGEDILARCARPARRASRRSRARSSTR